MVKSTTVRWLKHAVPSSGRGGTAAVVAQNEQTTEEHSTLEQQSPGRLDHPSLLCCIYPRKLLQVDVNNCCRFSETWKSHRHALTDHPFNNILSEHNSTVILARTTRVFRITDHSYGVLDLLTDRLLKLIPADIGVTEAEPSEVGCKTGYRKRRVHPEYHLCYSCHTHSQHSTYVAYTP